MTVSSILKEVREASYLAGVEFDEAYAYALWEAIYERILDEHANEGDWLFVHYDQMLVTEGRERLGQFLEVETDASFPDPKLRRRGQRANVPERCLELYDELCRRAEYREEATSLAARPSVAVIVPIRTAEDSDPLELQRLLGDVRSQRGVHAELVLVDATREGAVELEGAKVVREPSASRGDQWLAGLGGTSAGVIAWSLPRVQSLPSRLAHALEALESGAQLVTCDYVLAEADGRFVDRSHPASMADAPGPFWEAGVVACREVLERLARTAFAPVELELYVELGARGARAHVDEPGFVVAKEAFEQGWERSREDAQWLALQHDKQACQARPALTVSLCSYNRCDVLLECLEALCRQQLAAGTFEIVLVDDGSSDGTDERLRGLTFPIPVQHVRRENGGLSAARNTGLLRARGELVLFINDDTIAFPDLIERHLDAHAREAGRPTCVLGSFEQPPEALDNALLAYLEQSDEVFGFSAMTPLGRHDGLRFYTCNVSAPLAAVRRAGAFDPTFRHYGCEDTDLGLRLEKQGFTVLYDPRARAWHRHWMDLDYLRRRQQTVARAYVRLFKKHPEVIERWSREGEDRGVLRSRILDTREELPMVEAAVAELSRLDVGALRALGQDGVVDKVHARLADLVPRLNVIWWARGLLEGLLEHELNGFSELVAGGTEPAAVGLETPLRLLAWPSWERAELARLLERVRPLVEQGGLGLVLRRDPRRDPEREQALRLLDDVWREVGDPRWTLGVVLEERELGASEVRRLGRSVDGLLVTGSEPFSFLQRVAAEHLSDTASLLEWRSRYGSLEEASDGRAVVPGASATRLRPDVSVIVPTRDRADALARLLDALSDQDLDRDRFEVWVVDDGSRVRAREALADRQWPLNVHWLRQEGGGPAKARNRALRDARGDCIVFLNDDALPAADLLRRHRDGHRAGGARMLVGRFELLAKHRTHSLAELVETSNVLFAQPSMKPGATYGGLSFCTGNASARRVDLEAVGGFDESFPYPGGEDSELGLRLERATGAKVMYDPSLFCGHDHEMSVEAFARRKRIVGWGAHRIEALHGPLGLSPVDPGAGLESLAFEVEQGAGDFATLLGELEDVCRREVEAGCGPQVLEALRDSFLALDRFAFGAGYLAASGGHDPLDSEASAPGRLEPTRA